MGAVRTQCEHCQSRMKLPTEAVGRKVRCPKCAQPFRVAALEDSTAEIGLAEDESPAPAPSRAPRNTAPQRAKSQPAGRGATALAEDSQPTPPAPAEPELDMFAGLSDGSSLETDEDRAARFAADEARRARVAKEEADSAKAAAKGAKAAAKGARPKSAGGGTNIGETLAAMGIALISLRGWGRLNVGLFVFSGVLLWLGIQEKQLHARSSPTPQIISCADLTANGPGNNYHIKMQDFLLLPNYVYEVKRGSWSGAWVPAMAVGDALKVAAADLEVPLEELANWPDEQLASALEEIDFDKFNFRVIVEFPNVDGAHHVEAKFALKEIHGTILGSLDSDARRLFRDSYPQLDLDNLLVLVEGRLPWSKATVTNMFFGSAALLIGGIIMLVNRAKYIHDEG